MAGKSPRNQRRIGPYSRTLQRGALGNITDGRSELGRFIRALEAELYSHVGPNPSITERLLVEFIVKTKLQIDAFAPKLASGNWSGHDQRTFNALLGAHTRACRAIGLKAAPAHEPTLADVIADVRRRKAEAAA